MYRAIRTNTALRAVNTMSTVSFRRFIRLPLTQLDAEAGQWFQLTL
jgi:hypothetical protein